MRFIKGTKVEVLSLKEVTSGSWHRAEIIGYNSKYYTVRYEGEIEFLGKSMAEKVSQKAIRPCPPSMDVLQGWVEGDVVEVLHNVSWKMATILKVLGLNRFLVRLLGLAMDVEAEKHDLRARLCWQDGEWFVIGKASNKCEDLKFSFLSSRNDTTRPRKMVNFVSGRIEGGNEYTNESQAKHLKTLKRKISNVHFQAEAYEWPNKKRIILGNRERPWNELNATQLSHLPEKVEYVCSAREFKMNGGSKMIMEREKTYGDVGYSHSLRLESNDDASVSSSVASCSVYRNPSHDLHHVFASGQYEDNESQSSDAESFCQLRSKEGIPILPTKEVLLDEIHRLELRAYHCTIGALHASGPLSWEQEMLLTDLRDSLHVTNDEHLTEIRNLISSSICIPTS